VCERESARALKYPSRNAHAPYHMWPIWLYNIFPHFLINN